MNSKLIALHKDYQKISLGLYYLAIGLILTGLFFSRLLISIGFFIFFGNWILEADYKNKWKLFRKYKETTIISVIIIIHLIGLLNTENIAEGITDIKIKLPLLLPVFFVSSPILNKSFKNAKFLLLFATTAIIMSLIEFIRFEFFSTYSSIEDLFSISYIGQNIQLGLFIDFAICILVSFLCNIKRKTSSILLIILLIWLVSFVYIINSYTGIIILIILLIYGILILFRERNNFLFKTSLIVFGLAFIIFSFYIVSLINKFDKTEKVDFRNLSIKTRLGNAYQHDTLSQRTENGHYIDLYICPKELKKEWQKRSGFVYGGKDKKGQVLSETLIRYLSSKGLKKDSLGFSQLSSSDISFIENGCANYLYTNKYSLRSRVYNIYWQVSTYRNTGNSTAQSISQRIEFLKASKNLIKANFWFGVGTGDVMDSFRKELIEMKTKLEPSFFNRVHNQYIVEFVALGIIGFLVFVFIILYPFFKYKIWKNYLFTAFYIIMLVSFLTDNPLETQLSVSFYAIFFCLLIYDKNIPFPLSN